VSIVQTRQVQYFLAVVEHGGFGRAAAALGVAQPTLSQSVRSLERDLGIDLFHRAAHGVVLSAAGQALVGPARQLMRDLDTARATVGGSGGAPVVELVVAAELGVHPGAALVGAFSAAHPDIPVRMDKPETDDALPIMVRDGASELGLSYLPVPRLGLVEIELGTHELVIAFPPGATIGSGPVALSDLSGLSVIGLPRGNWQRELVEAALRAAGTRTRLVMEIAQRDAILDLVLAGVGATFMVGPAGPDAAARGAQVRGTDPPLRRPYGLVHRPVPLSDAAQAFVASV
jgi:DNA-binding transcriptional LysR family regulator